MLVVELMKAGIPCVEIRPTVLNFSAPMKHLDGLISAGRLKHDGCPVMTWMIGNTVALADAKDNVYPRKEQGESKIDGTVALLMALARDMAAPPPAQVSMYETMARRQAEMRRTYLKPIMSILVRDDRPFGGSDPPRQPSSTRRTAATISQAAADLRGS